METSNAWTTKGTIDYTRRLDEYKETVRQLFPNLPTGYVDSRSISSVDALALGYFLECCPRQVVVLDMGTSVGVSAFHFASQPKVLRVISVGPNPTVVDEIDDKSGTLGRSINLEPLNNLRVRDVAQAALAEFADERQKIDLQVDTVGNSDVDVRGGSPNSLVKAEIPTLETSGNVSLVAFVDGVHTKTGAQAILEAIFEKSPHAVAILKNCRGPWGPFVQAGVVNFTESVQGKYHFQLFGDLGPSIATSDLGIVYPDIDAAEAKHTLVELSELFSKRLDLLLLLRREEELINAVNRYKNAADKYKKAADRHKKAADRYKKVAGRLRTRNSRLNAQNSSQHELADTLAGKAPLMPRIKQLVRSTLMRTLVSWRPSGTDGRRAKDAKRPYP
jgi:hypothetical protein